MRYVLVLLAGLLAACSSTHTAMRNTPMVASSGWTVAFSPNMPNQLPSDGNGYYIVLPQADGVHYLVKAPQPVSIGQTITLTVEVVGTDPILISDPGDGPPATVRLFLWRQGDNLAADHAQYRYWSHPVNLTPGVHTLSVQVSPENWTDVFGQPGSANPAAFQAVLSNLQGIGFTCGGQSFAGHGIYTHGSVRINIISYTVN